MWIDWGRKRNYLILLSNLQPIPIIKAASGNHHIYFMEEEAQHNRKVWQFDVPDICGLTLQLAANGGDLNLIKSKHL